MTVDKAGFQTQSVAVESKFSATGGAAILGNAVVGGVIGGAVDLATGATRSLYPNPVMFKLVPGSGRGRAGAQASNPRPAADSGPSRTSKPAPPAPVLRRKESTTHRADARRFRTDKHGTQHLELGR